MPMSVPPISTRFTGAVSAHSVVAESGVALIAELFAHLVAQVGELVVYLVEFFLIVGVPLTLSLPSGKSCLVVGRGLVGGHLGKGALFAVEVDL